MRPTQNPDETPYERNQRFNFLVSWLHSFRYANTLALVRSLARTTEGKSIKVVEIGCAHAKLFSVLNQRLAIDYTGIEVSSLYVETAQSRYGNNPNFRVIHESVANAVSHLNGADVIVALETFEHMPEHEVVRIIEAIAIAQPRLFVSSCPVEIGPAIWFKNVGSLMTGYIRHREYSWAETFWAGLYQLDKLPPHGTGHPGFDWRWLAQTIRHNMKVVEIRRFSFGFLPAAFAFSVFIVAEPRKQ